ncbi:transcriptional regulator [Mammaliicoccus sciuri]|uniref:helix-turn-helix domain-containing protein n=1 Tax=Mammaliicoccus sciuri TaxID=1296 RepID=UPI000D1DC282|nr:helix-turn-helix transcriptional regulator [Mammaliicoccus sciuri]PTJ81258.1 transcriptional regulator [Mammaliicoccus sciuri]
MKNISNRRKELGYTQQEVADACNIDRAYLSLIESGKRVPSVKVAKRLGLKLEIDWTIFFDLECNKLKLLCT